MEINVPTDLGTIIGKTKKGVSSFLGIPYAKAPFGKNRFLPPVKAEPFASPFKAFHYPKDPIQYPFDGSTQNEDCLALNIFRKENGTDRKPVLFFIYGGSYATGGSKQVGFKHSHPFYDGSTFVREQDVLVVTFNYRLNVLGFLDLRKVIPEATLNNGLRDTVMALTWVHDHIVAFGGDPTNITVYGQSAGASLSLALLSVKAANPLFQRVILESPCVDAFYTPEQAQRMSEEWLTLAGHPDSQQLETMTSKELVIHNHQLETNLIKNERVDCTICPVVDGDMLTAKPRDTLSCNKKPLLIGFNHDEANVFTFLLHGKVKLSNPDFLPQTLFNLTPEEQQKAISSLSGFPSERTYAQLMTERMFMSPIVHMADSFATDVPVYFYRYDYVSPLLKGLKLDTCHFIEIPLVWNNPITLGPLSFVSFDRKRAKSLGKRIRKAWCSFSKGSAPEADWPPYDNTRPVRLFNKTDSLVQDPFSRLGLYH
jgi:para-nitrobenzyl esterase